MKKWYIVQVISILLIISICIGKNIQKNRLYDQNANSRWGDGFAQISIFYPLDEAPGEYFYFQDLTHKIETELEKSAVADELVIDKESGLSFPWGVSVSGKITITSDRGTVELNALGVSEDFFVFHPVELKYGSYIQSDDLMSDGIVIDEDAAWKLFGASDVVGMTVEINGIPHYIKGVVRKSEDRFSSEAGLEKSMCFTSMETLNSYGTIYGSYDYELIIPNPVDNFGMNLVRTTLGQSSEDLLLVENSSRYENSHIQDILLSFGVRSMSSTGAIYPYFENVARAWEDAFALLLFIEYALILLVITILVIHLWILYKANKLRKPHPFRWMLRVIKEYKRNGIYIAQSEKKQKTKEKRRKQKETKKIDDIEDLDELLQEKKKEPEATLEIEEKDTAKDNKKEGKRVRKKEKKHEKI